MSERDVLLPAHALRVERGRRRVLEDVDARAPRGRGARRRRAERRRQVDAGARARGPAASRPRGTCGCAGRSLAAWPRDARRARPRARHVRGRGPGQPDRGRPRGARALPAPGAVPRARRDRRTPPSRAPSPRPGSPTSPSGGSARSRRASGSSRRSRAASRRSRRCCCSTSRPRISTSATSSSSSARSTRCGGAAWRCWPSSTTSPALPPGRSAWCSWPPAGSPPRARRPRCSRLGSGERRLRRRDPGPRDPRAARPALHVRGTRVVSAPRAAGSRVDGSPPPRWAGQSEARKSSYGITSVCVARQCDSMPDQPRPLNT